MAIPLAARSAQPLPPMERCYDCGQAIPEGEVCRRTVAVNSSYSSGSISTHKRGSGKSFGDRSDTSGTYGGSTSTYAKVSLCPCCDAEREADERAVRIFLAIIVGLLAVAVAAVILWARWRPEPERRGAAAGPEAGALEAAGPEDAKEPPVAPNPEKGGKDQETAKRKQREEAEADERARQAAAERRAAAAAERAAAAEKKRREALEEWMAAEAEKKCNEDAEKKRREVEAKKAVKDEEFASQRLKYAKKLLDEGMDDLAKERLRKIIKEQPDTKAAAEAKKLLESMKPE
jgi:hypothetical protein